MTVALSGDTSPSDNLVAVCKGVDVLIHEPIDPDVLRRLGPDKPRMDAIVARHTTPEQASGILNRVSPRLAVFSHSPGTAAIAQQTRRSYPGTPPQRYAGRLLAISTPHFRPLA